MNKNVTLNEIRNDISITHEIGINVKAFILHGFPGEDLSTTKETIRLLEELKDKIDRISLFWFVPLPGSPIYKSYKKYDLILPNNFEEIYIYNNERKWCGNNTEQEELEQAYILLENYVKENWEKY